MTQLCNLRREVSRVIRYFQAHLIDWYSRREIIFMVYVYPQLALSFIQPLWHKAKPQSLWWTFFSYFQNLSLLSRTGIIGNWSINLWFLFAMLSKKVNRFRWIKILFIVNHKNCSRPTVINSWIIISFFYYEIKFRQIIRSMMYNFLV